MEKDSLYQGNVSQPAPAPQNVNAPRHGSSHNPFDPLNLLRTLLRNWLIIGIFVGLGGAGAYIYTRLAKRIYKAEAVLEMSVRRPKVVNNEAVIEDFSHIRDEGVIFNTRFTKFKSPAMEKLATKEYFERYPEDKDYINKYLLSDLIRLVDWKKDPKANIVYVTYFGEDPQFAAKLVNVMTHCAGVLMMEENKAQSDEAVKWLKSQEEELRLSLEEIDGQLADIRKEVKIDSLEQRKAALGQALITVSSEREGLISTLASRRTVYDYVLELKKTDPNMEMLPTGLPKEEQLNELIRTWREAHEELQLASGRYTKLHPEYKQIAETELRARRRLEQFIDLSAKAVQNEIELLQKQVEQVDGRINAMKKEALELEEQLLIGKQRLQELDGKRAVANTAYQSILRRKEEARLSADENMAFAKVIMEAEVPHVPVSPRRLRILIMGIFLGGFAGSVLVILGSLLNDKITSVTDLRSLKLNILGTVPTQKRADDRSGLATIGLRDKFNHIVEIFAGINSLLSSSRYKEQTRVMLVCSVLPGEGKTITSCNLAISAALNGTKTLLIDGDLRRPQLENVFGVDKSHPSLLEWLVDGNSRLTHRELVARNVIENLDLITSRPLKEVNPAEMLGRGRLAELLEWAQKNYDRIIIDSPPLGAVGDAQVLANLSDCVLIVSRLGKTRRRGLKYAIARFEEINTPVIGCIANDVPHSLAGMFSGAEGYGYGYGYGSSHYKPYTSD